MHGALQHNVAVLGYTLEPLLQRRRRLDHLRVLVHQRHEVREQRVARLQEVKLRVLELPRRQAVQELDASRCGILRRELHNVSVPRHVTPQAVRHTVSLTHTHMRAHTHTQTPATYTSTGVR
jgi:hypothetical protein